MGLIDSENESDGSRNSAPRSSGETPVPIRFLNSAPTQSCCPSSAPEKESERPSWVVGTLMTAVGQVYRISTELTGADRWEHIKSRTSAYRDNFTVRPGLYAAGAPDPGSDVLVSANYKLSFDMLRKELKGQSLWILVLDTKGINVWCAAGKGTFGSEELISRMALTKLDRVVTHRRIIIPQLGAPGVSAYKVQKATGFRVFFGPVRAADIGGYLSAGRKATRQMRTVSFTLFDRLVLTPMEINPAMKKYYPWYAIMMLAVFGLRQEGIIFRDAVAGGGPFLLLGLVSVFAGAFLTPALLPVIPFRSFALKGWITGLLSMMVSFLAIPSFGRMQPALIAGAWLFFPIASSYIALQFTGSTTFTGISGVKKELRLSIPLYIAGSAVSLVLLLIYKFGQWRSL